MKFTKVYFNYYKWCVLIAVFFVFCPVMAQDTRFTVVIDAGHGGHDPGAMGSISREKDINLALVLELGAIIEDNYKDVKVVYTRKTDVYLTLQERADVVNNHHADLFICIHTNSAQSGSAYGAETFTLGLAKTKANLDVAMRENSVILLEEDYRTKYRGFDPNSVDSYIMFEFMQDKYIDKSVELASIIQKQFVNYNRSDRGVRQAGFWVLHRSACPSVLVELGFISNNSEEHYLLSDKGRREMATAVFKAFEKYKFDHDKKSGRQAVYKPKNLRDTVKEERRNESKLIIDTAVPKPVTITNEPVTTEVKTENITANNVTPAPVFKIQLLSSLKKLKLNSPDFKGLHNIDFFIEGRAYKYTLGAETEFTKIEKTRREILRKFPDAFIIAFVDGKKLPMKETLKLFK